jgi:uncharacterized membrane protein
VTFWFGWLVTRPYVTGFLCGFLFLALRRWGWQRTLWWLLTGYGVALLSEASSIRSGIPYGLYHYHYDVLTHDPLVLGVPLWDSLSYPFMIYAGYALAGWARPRWHAWQQALGGASATMLLDVVIDPVASRGSEWFLGNIYHYATPGWYFGVPLSNFVGWFIVPLVVILMNQWAWRVARVPPTRPPDRLDALFYFAIMGFGIGIALWIGEWGIAMASGMVAIVAGLVMNARND